MNKINLKIIGEKFGRLIVISFSHRTKHHSYFFCRCSCGNEKVTTVSCLRSGDTKSCGCLQKEIQSIRCFKHGKSYTRTYMIWAGMLDRCNNPNKDNFNKYGGRGIKVCERWHKFKNFYEDMKDAPFEMTLDRIDNDGNYCRENCRWATRKEQSRNRKNNILIEFNDKIKCISEWAEEIGISKSVLYSRLGKLGWSVQRALTTPIRK